MHLEMQNQRKNIYIFKLNNEKKRGSLVTVSIDKYIASSETATASKSIFELKVLVSNYQNETKLLKIKNEVNELMNSKPLFKW